MKFTAFGETVYKSIYYIWYKFIVYLVENISEVKNFNKFIFYFAFLFLQMILVWRLKI